MLRQLPRTTPRRLVATADKLYVTLGYEAPVSVLDAATGRELSVLEGTEGTDEILLDDGVYVRHFLEERDEKKLKVGMRVEAVWKEDDERGEGTADIKYFRTIDE